MISAPMLAEKCKDTAGLVYPLLATPKLDGIRCLKLDSLVVSRNFKPIPNHFTRQRIELTCPDGLDGELMVNGAEFNTTSSGIMSRDGEPDFVYHVFDFVVNGDISMPYEQRMAALAALDLPVFCVKVLPIVISNEDELLSFEQKCLAEGYEGVMVRAPGGPYKCGRSTVREGYLLKVKRFLDSEATVVGMEEQLHNSNAMDRDAFGYAKRSSHQDNMIPKGVLGALLVTDIKSGVAFSVGTGFTADLRKALWEIRDTLPGRIVKYKYQPTGIKDAPRFPVFLGFRDEGDMS